MSEITVREYQPEDRATVEQGILELQEEEHLRRPHFWASASPEIATAHHDWSLNKLTTEPEMKIYVGVVDGVVAGWIIVKAVKTEGPEVVLKKYGYINELGVLKKYQKRGVGLVLMNKAEEYIKSLGLEWMGLNTTIGNPALDFYKRLGYQEQSVRLDKKLN